MAGVPVLTLSIGGEEINIERVEATRSNSISMHIDPESLQPKKRKSKKEEAIEYFNKFQIPDKMNALVTQLLLQKPESPMAFCIQYMRTQTAIGENGNPASPVASSPPSVTADQVLKAKLGDASSREYLLRHKLPWMFDDLLSNLLLEKPEDPLGFCLTWIRWNCSKYVQNAQDANLGIRLGDYADASVDDDDE